MKKLWRVILGLLFLVGCGGYWMVTDPTTKNAYYTEVITESGGGGVRFIDAKTGNEVTLQNTEVKEVTKDEFKAAVGKKAIPKSSISRTAGSEVLFHSQCS